MSVFQDAMGRKWELHVNPATMKRVQSLTGFSLGKALASEEHMQQLNQDIVLLVDVVYALCKPQAEKAGVTDEAFGEAMVGDVFQSMVAALIEAITDFFPSESRRLIKAATQEQKGKPIPMRDRQAG
jgi:hypothetical protein